MRFRPQHADHVWWYDFVEDRTQDGRTFRALTVMDEFSRRSLAIVVARRLRSDDVLHCLAGLFACTVRRSISARTTALNLPPRRCAAGSAGSG
jgi:transposase InsO family protein